jgi:glutamine---fructose-6-phosphate transaminase (isomerizing)
MVQMWEEIMEQPTVLGRCLHTNEKVIASLVTAVKNRNVSSIIIAARGTSDHAAVYGKYVLEMLTGIPVSLAAPSIFTMYGKSVQMGNSLVLGISQSGKAADVAEVIRAANAQGAVTAAITNFTDSPLAVEAQYHLFCDCGLERSVAATKTFTAQLYLISQLAAAWTCNEDFKRALAEVPEGLKKTFEEAQDVETKVERYRFMKECFVLARGVNYAIALESALKIQETTYTRAKAFATSDFHHGPFAMIEKDMPVIVYAPEGPSLKDVTGMIQKLREHEAEIVIVSNKEELAQYSNCFLKIPKTDNDFISPFYNVAVAQMFACRLALAKGLNPDSPRGLNKVTITR